MNCICSAAFCESAALRAGARSPERADFPRPGEDVTAGDKKGNLSRSDGGAMDGEAKKALKR